MRCHRYLRRSTDPENIRLCYQNWQKVIVATSRLEMLWKQPIATAQGQHTRYVTVDIKLTRCDPVSAVKPRFYEGIVPSADVLSSIHDVRLQQ